MEQKHHRGQSLDYLTVYPDGYAEGKAYPLVICLHGYGADMTDLAALAPALDSSGYLYVLPNGPLPAFDGADLTARAWYERGGNESAEAVSQAMAALDGFVQEVVQRYRVPAGKAVLLGFSQGGALALRYGLPRPRLFAELAVLSGSLRRVEDLLADLPGEPSQPVFVSHGTLDSLVPVEWSRQLVRFLQAQGYQPFFKTYRMGHQITPAFLADLRGWIITTLSPLKPDRGSGAISG